MKYLDTVIDCSHHNTITDFNAIKQSGTLAMFHKATQGTSMVDKKYIARKNGCEEAGLLFGAYHFGTGGNVKDQVNNFLSVVNPADNPIVLLCLDYEDNNNEMSFNQCVEFVKRINDSTGKYPVLYSGAKIKADLQSNDIGILINCPLWISHYTSKEKLKFPKQFPRVTFWQYTDKGRVDGISGNVDKNYFNGSEEQLKKIWGV